jgi:hypothetical protein
VSQKSARTSASGRRSRTRNSTSQADLLFVRCRSPGRGHPVPTPPKGLPSGSPRRRGGGERLNVDRTNRGQRFHLCRHLGQVFVAPRSAVSEKGSSFRPESARCPCSGPADETPRGSASHPLFSGLTGKRPTITSTCLAGAANQPRLCRGRRNDLRAQNRHTNQLGVKLGRKPLLSGNVKVAGECHVFCFRKAPYVLCRT